MVLEALVISLPERKANVQAIRAQLEPYGVKVTELEAFDARIPANLQKEEAKLVATQFFQINKPRSQHSQAATPGAIGVFLSYRRAWTRIAAMSRPCLVLEDDFELNESLGSDVIRQYLDQSVSLLEQETFDCICMTGNLGVARKAVESKRGIVRMISPFGNGAGIMYSPRGAKILLEELPFCLGHADLLIGFVAYKLALAKEKFVVGMTIDTVAA
jgi:hypothetical protein